MAEDEERRRSELSQWFGDAVRRHRERQDMSQDDLARQMSARGWPWHQSTVYKIEQGQRKTQAIEVHDLAEILGVSMDRLFRPGPEEAAVAFVDRASWLLTKSWRGAADAIEQLLRDLAGAGRAVDTALESNYPRARQAAEDLAGEMNTLTPQAAADEALARFGDSKNEGEAGVTRG